jgi:hypothetical protein
VEAKAKELLASIAGKNEQTKTPQQLTTMLPVKFAQKRVPPPMHKPIQALAANEEWLAASAIELGWGVEFNDDETIASITIPANA